MKRLTLKAQAARYALRMNQARGYQYAANRDINSWLAGHRAGVRKRKGAALKLLHVLDVQKILRRTIAHQTAQIRVLLRQGRK